MLARLPDWRERLAAWQRAASGRAPSWGAGNCVLTAADAVLAITGADIAAPLRGHEPSRFGALLRLRRLGFASVAGYFDAVLPRAGRARAGDLICTAAGPLNAAAIADGRGSCWGYALDSGLTCAALPGAHLCWAVG